jgi:2-polyprenyl-3-methyl-5-hydroxy-6-metoxy-1,4-benzoquinol methylase
MVGCGNAKLSEEMYADGFTNILNIDISEVVIYKMKEAHPEMTWDVADATQMTYEDGSFDLVIDKGTYDALACADDKTAS